MINLRGFVEGSPEDLLYRILTAKIEKRHGREWVLNPITVADLRVRHAIRVMKQYDGGGSFELGFSRAQLDAMREAVCDLILSDGCAEPDEKFDASVKNLCLDHCDRFSSYFLHGFLLLCGAILIIAGAVAGCRAIIR